MNTISTSYFSIQATTNTQTGTTDVSVAPSSRPDLLPGVQALLSSADPGAMLAALTMQTAHDEAKIDRQARASAARAQEDAEAAEVQDIHDKATLQRIQGFVDGALDIAKGACDLDAGLAEAGDARQKAEAGAERQAAAEAKQNGTPSQHDVNEMKRSANALDAGAAASQKKSACWSGVGSAFGAAKSAADGMFQGAISDKDADEKTHEASADAFKQIADDAHDDEKDAKDLLNKALDFYKEYVDTKNQTVMAAIHRA